MTYADKTETPYPLLPDYDDPRWRDAVVRSRSQTTTELRRLPRSQLSQVIQTIYVGDSVAVMRKARYSNWIAVRVGYRVGWVDLMHVDFTLMPHQPKQEMARQLRQQIDTLEDGKDERPTSRGEVSRIINYLKGMVSSRRDG